MSEGEIREFIPRFLAMLRESGFGWAVRQVAANLTNEEVAEMDDQEIIRLFQQLDNPTEPLLQLLNALEILIVETATMENEIREFFSSEDQTDAVFGRRLFQVKSLEAEEELLIPSQLFSQQRQSAALNMKIIIDQLREQIR